LITCPENIFWAGDRNAARLPRSRFFSAARLIVDSQIQPAIKRTEALKIHKYLQPGYFVMGSHRSKHDSGIKRASYSFKKLFFCQVASPGHLAQRSNNVVELNIF
jgi:hypothetical protein